MCGDVMVQQRGEVEERRSSEARRGSSRLAVSWVVL